MVRRKNHLMFFKNWEKYIQVVAFKVLLSVTIWPIDNTDVDESDSNNDYSNEKDNSRVEEDTVEEEQHQYDEQGIKIKWLIIDLEISTQPILPWKRFLMTSFRKEKNSNHKLYNIF